jgi:DNA polymerase-1
MGSIQKYKVKTKIKLGKKYRVQTDEPYKNRTKCKTCTGAGAIYQSTGVAAGLRMSPSTAFDASINGFKTDKETIKGLILQAERKKNDIAVEFLTKISRLSALSVYLDSFVAGIQRGTRNTGFLHANFNQCVAATGRLSSGGGMSINLQNQPKRGFPVRKCFISRFENGIWIESDYSGLEFRTACELSRDSQGLADILEGKDIHRQTASICLKKPASHVTKDERQGHKWASFQPLFGGTGFGMPDHIKAYFDRFYGIYEGIYGWHQSLMTGTLKNGTVETPSGRQYFWPNVERTKNGRVTSATQILNYPVQGFSADLVQLACIRAFKLFKQADLRSKLTLTVHDSICVDTHPDEIEQVKSILTEAMTGVGEEAEKRFGYKTIVPLDIEISGGPNWLEQQEYA